MRRASALLLAAALASGGGRAVADPPVPSSAPPPAPAPSLPPAPPAAFAEDGEVRLTLADAVRAGRASNLRLLAGSYDPAIAWERYVAAVASFDVLLTAGLDVAHDEVPTTVPLFTGTDVVTEDSVRASVGARKRLLNGGEVALLYKADRVDSDSAFVVPNPSWQQGPAVEVRQPLLRGRGWIATADVHRACNDRRGAGEAQRALEHDVVAEVAAAYWELAYAQEQVSARAKAREVAGRLWEDQRARLDAQVATPLDLAEARAGVEQRAGELVVAQAQRRAASDLLRTLILPFGPDATGGPLLVASDDPRADAAPDPDPAASEVFVRTALALRPELLASRAALDNRDIDVAVARNAVLPQLDLKGRLGTQGLDREFFPAMGDAAAGEAVSGAVGLELSFFPGQRAAKAEWRLTEWARRQSVLRHREIENRVVAEVRAAVRDVVSARARWRAASAEVAAAAEGLAGEEDRLANGSSTPFRVLEKEQSVTDARLRESRAAADLCIARARLERAVGS